jgi:hypothetical protein
MQDFSFTIKIRANTQAEAKEQAQALVNLKNALSPADLLLFSRKVQENPGLIQTAKNWL